MKSTQRYSICTDKITFRILDGEAVVLNIDNGYYYSLNEVGTKIWQFIDKQKSFAEILSAMKAEYDISEKQLQCDIADLLKELEREELIKNEN